MVRLTVFSNWYIPILASQTRNSAKVSSNNSTRSSKTENILWQSKWSRHRFANRSRSQHEVLACCTYFVLIVFNKKLSLFLSSINRFGKSLLESNCFGCCNLNRDNVSKSVFVKDHIRLQIFKQLLAFCLSCNAQWKEIFR